MGWRKEEGIKYHNCGEVVNIKINAEKVTATDFN